MLRTCLRNDRRTFLHCKNDNPPKPISPTPRLTRTKPKSPRKIENCNSNNRLAVKPKPEPHPPPTPPVDSPEPSHAPFTKFSSRVSTPRTVTTKTTLESGWPRLRSQLWKVDGPVCVRPRWRSAPLAFARLAVNGIELRPLSVAPTYLRCFSQYSMIEKKIAIVFSRIISKGTRSRN